jgi:phenylpyruvate tautomerase PptA (4-oxalocrotonate tautomerase family)
MPNVAINGPKLDIAAKRALVKEITDAMEKAYKIPRQVYQITIYGNEPDSIGVGGILLCDREKE